MKHIVPTKKGACCLLLWVAFLITHVSHAQDRRVTGRVLSGKDQQPIPGVNILVKNTQLGTTTDANGAFSLNIPGNATIVFSAIGFAGQEVAIGNQSQVNVTLTESSQNLSEVIVTALGIRKESKRLGYATATVDPNQLTTNRTANFANALQGKVAGLNVTAPQTGPGGTSKIRIRGQSSFKGDNSPLIIVNGVPINNSNFSTRNGDTEGTSSAGSSASDGGDGLQSINPDDIETMTVLKGSTAAALYGFRAKDGAILITTKTGRRGGGIGVEYNSNFTAETAIDATDFQYEYGQGENGLRPKTIGDAQSSGIFSFGEKIDGQPTIQFDGVQRPYSANQDRVKQFYQTGTNWVNTIALSGGNEKGNFRVSFANLDAKGIVPNSAFNKKTFNLGLTYQFSDKLSTQVNANYSNEISTNPPQVGVQTQNPNAALFTLSNTIQLDVLRDGMFDENGNERPTSRFTPRNNPWWSTLVRFENIKRDRVFGNASLRYQPASWLYIQGRVGQDYFSRNNDYNVPTGSRQLGTVSVGYNGAYYQDVRTFREVNLDFLVGATKAFGKFGIDLTVGGNQLKQVSTINYVTVDNFFIRGLYTVANGQIKNPQYGYGEKRVNSLYATAEFSYNNVLFLNATARNDWFSTLNPQSNSYLYPSVSGSLVFSDAFSNRPTWLNYGKLRAAYAEVGGDTDPYQADLYYGFNANSYSAGSFSGVPLGTISNGVRPNPNLRPLKVRELELGLELRLFNNRVLLDAAVYNKNTVDEILNVDISNASGYSKDKVNIGRLRNQGAEMLLTLRPIVSNKFEWESSLNLTYNQSKVLELAGGQARLQVGTGEFIGIVAHELNQPMASLRGISYRRDAQGRIIVSGGLPSAGDIVTFGSAIPKVIGGWTNTFTIRGFRISAQIDGKFGHKLVSNSNFNYWRHGLHKSTLEGRTGGVLFDGVNGDGTPNSTRIANAQQFYTQVRNINLVEPFVYDASFIRWRTLSVGYDLSRFVNKTFIKGLTVSAIANNLALLKSSVENVDPESVSNASDNLQGIETHSLPITRSYGFNLNLKF